jgi:hypothetical protein
MKQHLPEVEPPTSFGFGIGVFLLNLYFKSPKITKELFKLAILSSLVVISLI